jgi:hypothetical protein
MERGQPTEQFSRDEESESSRNEFIPEWSSSVETGDHEAHEREYE